MGNCLDVPPKVDDFVSSKGHSAVVGGEKGGKTKQDSNPRTALEARKCPPKRRPVLSILTFIEKGRTGKLPSRISESEILPSPHVKALSFSELKNATRNFRPDGLLGEGGFGYVYKGWLDEQTLAAAKSGSGIVVAVKKLKPQGFQGHKEWLSEVNCLGQLHHPNLVKLIGYCLDGDNRLLVYEFMRRGSLENHLFKRSAQPLSWETRVKVAIGAARGLCFLHSSESQEFNAKLSDFGLAKAGPTGDQTHVSTQVMGTHGYAAPEYVATGRLTAKCDVYSFGVVLLELLTGRRAVDKTKTGIEQKLVEWAQGHLDDKRKIFRIMDTRLGGQYPRKGACMAATLAMDCVSSNAKSRPHMDEVLAILEELPSPKCMFISSPLEKPTIPSPYAKSPACHDTLTPRGSPLPAHMKSPKAR